MQPIDIDSSSEEDIKPKAKVSKPSIPVQKKRKVETDESEEDVKPVKKRSSLGNDMVKKDSTIKKEVKKNVKNESGRRSIVKDDDDFEDVSWEVSKSRRFARDSNVTTLKWTSGRRRGHG